MLPKQIEKDLKAAMLAGDDLKVSVLKSLKNALQYEAVAGGQRSQLDEAKIQQVLGRQAKQRAEAAEIYQKAGESARAEAELAEKAIIDSYLPEQASETEVAKIVDEELALWNARQKRAGKADSTGLAKLPGAGAKDIGRVIGAVRARLGGSADGALIAKLVKAKLEER